MMRAKITVFILILALTLSVAVFPAAADFSDLENHWAQEYMEALAELGYLTGYEDGTMRPDSTISAAELFALLSRLYAPDEETAAIISDDYSAVLSENVPDRYSWALDELAICLAAGIVSEEELQDISLSASLNKEKFSAYTAKALRLGDFAAELGEYDTGLSDMDEVSEENLPYVRALVAKGIINGNELGEFQPRFRMTRAVAATIVYRALETLGESEALTIPGYSDIAKISGIVVEINDTSLRLRGKDGILREYSAAEDASNVGRFADLWTNGGTVLRAEYYDTEWVQGVVSANRVSSTKPYITVVDASDGSSANYYVNEETPLWKGDEQIKQNQLKTDCFVTFRALNDIVAELYWIADPVVVDGFISELGYGTTVDFSITSAGGEVYIMPLSMSELPALKLGEMDITLDQLKTGDKVSAEVRDGKVKTVTAQLPESTAAGTLASVTTDALGVSWQITAPSGETRLLRLDRSVKIVKNGKTISSGDVNIGDDVTATLYGDTVVKIEISKEKTASSSTLSGTVLAVDSSKKRVTILEGDQLYYVDASSVSIIVDAPEGKSIRLSSLNADDHITAYGVYSSASTLAAVTIIIDK
jgi:hypothetical protein